MLPTTAVILTPDQILMLTWCSVRRRHRSSQLCVEAIALELPPEKKPAFLVLSTDKGKRAAEGELHSRLWTQHSHHYKSFHCLVVSVLCHDVMTLPKYFCESHTRQFHGFWKCSADILLTGLIRERSTTEVPLWLKRTWQLTIVL